MGSALISALAGGRKAGGRAFRHKTSGFSDGWRDAPPAAAIPFCGVYGEIAMSAASRYNYYFTTKPAPTLFITS